MDQLPTDSGFNLAVCVLASGSRGNAVYVSDGETDILVDAGIAANDIIRRLRSKGLRPENLDGIVVSHEHTDHVRGVGVLSRKFDLPVYMTRKTSDAIGSQTGRLHDAVFFSRGETFQLKTLTIHPFSISHDAEDPAGFTVSQNGTKIGIATDLGVATSVVKTHLQSCTLLILEANHDAEMLTHGPYPWPLKQRINSRVGHLSNEAAKNLLNEVQHDRLVHVVLAHLSEINNTPQKALTEVSQAITRCNAQIDVAMQDVCGELFRLE